MIKVTYPEIQDKIALFENLHQSHGISGIVDKLKERGFFEYPAAIKYHHNNEGGLFDHSYEVYLYLLTYFNNIFSKLECFEIGFFHDLCKLKEYVKDNNGNFVKSPLYSDPKYLKNHSIQHGMLSLTILEEELGYKCSSDKVRHCIVFHQGVYGLDTEGLNLYDKAVKDTPEVLIAHVADMLSAKLHS